MRTPDISIVGYGNLGRALVAALKKQKFRIAEIVTRSSARPAFDAAVTWICVPDRAIAQVARQIAPKTDWRGKVVLHSSGALPASVLAPLRQRGAAIGSAHPLNTFVAGSKPDFRGVPFAVEGDPVAVRTASRIAKRLNGGGEVFAIRAAQKPLYHAMGAFASPLLVALLANAELVGRAAGLKDPKRVLKKILQTTMENYFAKGAAASFSGPIARGDAATVRKHLAVLRRTPGAREVYRALTKSALASLPSKLERL